MAVDLATLRAFAAEVDDPATVAAVVDAYLAELPRTAGRPRGGSGPRDLATVADIGHTLGPSSAMLGARRARRAGGGAGAGAPAPVG